MSAYFFYVDGQGYIYSETGKKIMNWEDDVNQFCLDALTNIRQYLAAQIYGKSVVNAKLDETMEEKSTNIEAIQHRKH
jgi:hypothetical protein